MALVAEALLDWGVASSPLRGQERSGDDHLVFPFPGGVLVAAMDGVGHGQQAAQAALVARQILEAHPGEPVVDLVQRCHAALRDTRGVVMSLASIDGTRRLMSWMAVGNVQGGLRRAGAGGPEELLLRSGVVGAQLPTLQATAVRIAPGDTLIFATDGIEGDFSRALARGGSAQAAAESILTHHGRHPDDALVLVARYLGGRR